MSRFLLFGAPAECAAARREIACFELASTGRAGPVRGHAHIVDLRVVYTPACNEWTLPARAGQPVRGTQPYAMLVMECVRGRNIKGGLVAAGGPLQEAFVVQLVLQLLPALRYLHEDVGIAHGMGGRAGGLMSFLFLSSPFFCVCNFFVL